MSYNRSPYEAVHPEDADKAREYLVIVRHVYVKRGLTGTDLTRAMHRANGRVMGNLRELQRLNDLDAVIIVPIARTRWPYE